MQWFIARAQRRRGISMRQKIGAAFLSSSTNKFLFICAVSTAPPINGADEVNTESCVPLYGEACGRAMAQMR